MKYTGQEKDKGKHFSNKLFKKRRRRRKGGIDTQICMYTFICICMLNERINRLAW